MEPDVRRMTHDISVIVDFLNHLQDARRIPPVFRTVWRSLALRAVHSEYLSAMEAADRLQGEIAKLRQRT